jgi:hypothetical protein
MWRGEKILGGTKHPLANNWPWCSGACACSASSTRTRCRKSMAADRRYDLQRLKLICEDAHAAQLRGRRPCSDDTRPGRAACLLGAQGRVLWVPHFLSSPGNLKAVIASDGIRHLKSSSRGAARRGCPMTYANQKKAHTDNFCLILHACAQIKSEEAKIVGVCIQMFHLKSLHCFQLFNCYIVFSC